MNILGFDSSGSACSVALLRGEDLAAWRFEAMARGHAEALMPMVMDVLEKASMPFGDLDALAVTVGPGSFTGLRVGLAAARGLSLARDLPVIGVTTLETVAFAVCRAEDAAALGGRHVISAMETKRSDIYAQVFSTNADAVSEASAMMPEGIAAAAPPGPLVIAGDAARRAAAAFDGSGRDVRVSAHGGAVDARCVVGLARARQDREGLPQRAHLPAPLYIHPPRARVPANQGRLRP